MTKAKRYNRYSSEFKREAILRAGEEGVTDRAVCDELGISTRQFRRTRDEEMAGLKRELAQVKTERDFLKQAAAYFARVSK